MIITRSPLRISFFGGGTDFPEYYSENGGAVLATSVNRYSYINASQFPSSLFDYSIRVSYSRGELVKSPKDIEHPVFRACLERVGISSDIELHAILDMPAFTGLGSSSAFTVSLLHALHAFRGDRVTASMLASEAIHIEREVLGECVGVQDQLMAAHGGFCFIEFAGGELPRVSQVRISLENLLALQSHMLLVFTNIKRRAQDIEKTKLQAMRNSAPALRQIHQCCREALGIFEAPGPLDIAAIGRLLDESWQRKKSLSGSVSNETIDHMHEIGKRHGAYGGKILGAGGGGFILFLAPPDRHACLKKVLADFHIQNVEIGVPGSEVIFNATSTRSYLT
jgi:D-glycero-alpha-D-manno-heptose-7-phosphate kinase